MKNVEGFLESAQKGIVTVEFRKIDTDELRIMPCTLNSEVANTKIDIKGIDPKSCLLYTSPSPRDQRGSRMPSSA